jgi:hypothetical protein
MPKISDDVVRAVTEAAKIEEVVGDFIPLRKAGVNLTGLCPFHDDQNDGNFIVRPSTVSNFANTYHCFACMGQREGGGPVDFLMKAEHMSFPDAIRYLGKKYCIEVDDVPVNWMPPPPKPTPPPPPTLEMRREWVRELMKQDYNHNIFTYWFGMLPWSQEQRARMQQTLWMYCVGCYKDGRVVFWQIDHTGIPRAAKLMKYETNGHRYKEKKGEKNATGWLYNQDGYRDICRPSEHTIIKPLFGAHLLKRYPEARVNIVESEKTALVMANFYGNPDKNLWLACGGLKFLSIEAMQPLIDQKREVWLWPDKDGLDEWVKLRDKLGYDGIKIYETFLRDWWKEEEDGPKADCADITIRMMSRPETVTRNEQPKAEQDATAKIEDDVLPLGTSTALNLVEWKDGEPFLDPDEYLDPRVHKWRDILRRRYNFNKTRNDRRISETKGRDIHRQRQAVCRPSGTAERHL